jgi:hypothetical protein
MIANPDVSKLDAKLAWQFYCTEKSITENFHQVFGFKCDVFAKLLYFNMSRQKVHAKIDFSQFVSVFDDLLDEVQKLRNRTIFNLLDVKKQGKLDVMVLIQIINNLDLDTHFAFEIMTILREYKSKNVLMSAGFSRQITLNFATFNELIPCSCLIDEL